MQKSDLRAATPSPSPFPEASGKGSAFGGIGITSRSLAINEVFLDYFIGTTEDTEKKGQEIINDSQISAANLPPSVPPNHWGDDCCVEDSPQPLGGSDKVCRAHTKYQIYCSFEHSGLLKKRHRDFFAGYVEVATSTEFTTPLTIDMIMYSRSALVLRHVFA